MDIDISMPENDKPEPVPLKDVISAHYEGVFKVEGIPNHRIFINALNNYFVFAITPSGMSVLVYGKDDGLGNDGGWLDKKVYPANETMEVNFKSK